MSNKWIACLLAGFCLWAFVGSANYFLTKNHQQKVYTYSVPVVIPEVTVKQIKIDVDEMHCLAKNIYFEARGESIEGKIAVANVTMNRVDSRIYPNSLCKVVYQAKHSKWWMESKGKLVPIRNQCQFSWYCDGKSDRLYLTTSSGTVIKDNMNAWLDSIHVAEEAIRGNLDDITQGSTHYHADYVKPHWSMHYTPVTKIGAHIFYTSL
jgi:spore germination cell wall hydrolase CwlJ-like protein